MSVGAALRWGVAALKAAELDTPGTDARRLLADVLGVDRARLSGLMQDPMPAGTATQYEALIRRRTAREPVARILGYRDFWRHRFRVTPDVLDPRPETETLVALALEEPFGRVLDLGTGSGCIVISLLAERPEARGVATDVSERAVLIAGENAEAAGVVDRLVLPISDWFADISGRYDLIVSNPPYIAVAEMADLAPEVRDHDPRAALTDGGDGLAAYRAIAAGAGDHLTPGGRLIVEIGASQGSDVVGLFTAAGLESVAVHSDLNGKNRVVSARKPWRKA